MDKKAKIDLAAIKISPASFLKCKRLLAKHTAKNAAKKTFLLTRYFLALIIIVNFFLCYVAMLLYGLLGNKLFPFMSYKLKIFLIKRS